MTHSNDSERGSRNVQASSQKSILIVDDDISIRANVRDLLTVSGYQVFSASDGLQALGVMERHTPDLIISDINMPSMDGYVFFETARTNPDWTLIPFIFLTARDQPPDVRRGIGLGVDQYLTKPFHSEDLLVAVEARLKRIREIENVTHSDVEAMKQRLMNAISHELRTPLTYIYGYVGLLQEDHSDLSADEFQEMVNTMRRGTERLMKLVEDLLLVVRLDSGALRLEIEHGRQPTPLDRLLLGIVGRQAAVSEGRGISIETKIAPGLNLRCEPAYLRDALSRLVDNAIKFSRSPGGRVWVSAEQVGESIRILVQDDGLGVSVDRQKLLFRPFHQVDREQHEQQGLGLGLAIARGIIEQHGGRIELSSEGIPGQGSTFTVVLPAEQ